MSTTNGAAPFVTKRSTLGFAAAYLVGSVIFELLWGANGGFGTGTIALITAGVGAVALITSLVAWINGMVLAVRGKSVFWFVIAFLLPPIGSVGCALWCKQA